jgi:hypothetical protein
VKIEKEPFENAKQESNVELFYSVIACAQLSTSIKDKANRAREREISVENDHTHTHTRSSLATKQSSNENVYPTNEYQSK